MNARKNALYNVAYRVFSILLPLVTSPYLSRVCGQTGVGLYSFAWSVSYLFCLLGMLGLENYGVRAIAQVRHDTRELDRVFTEVYCMQLLVAGAALAGYLGYACFLAGAEKTIALHLTMMSVSCMVNLDWCLMGLEQFKPIALRNTAVKLLATMCVFLFVHSAEDLWIYALVWSLATLLGCVSCALSLRGRVRLVRVRARSVLRHLPPCAVLCVSVLAVNVFRTMDKVMVGALSSMEQNGLYANAEKIVYCLSGFISAIGTVMLPRASALLRRGKRDAVLEQMDVSMQAVLCMVCALSFGLASISEMFAPLFFGAQFVFSGQLMVPLSFTLVAIGFANVIRTQWILPQERDGIFVRSVLCGAAVNLLLNILLIPRFGSAGAVPGTLLAECAVPLTQYILLRGELPYRRYLRYLLQYSLIGSVMLLFVQLIGPVAGSGWLGAGIRVGLGALLYAALCLAMWKATGNRAMLRLLRPIREKTV